MPIPAALTLLLACGPPAAPHATGEPEPEPEPQRGSGPPNVLVLLTDDQGVDKVGVYGEHPTPPPTPNIDAFAAEGVLFRNAYAAPICSPGRAALLTGRYGRRTGIGGVIQLHDGSALSPGEVLIPEMLALADVPYTNSGIGKWHLASIDAPNGLDHPNVAGFDHYAGALANLYDTIDDDGERYGYTHWEKVTDGVLTVEDRYATTVQVDDALDAIATLPEPWFVYVGFSAPHEPLDPPPVELAPISGALSVLSPRPLLYAAVVEALDTEIGRLLGSIDPDVKARTTIFLMSDNGTPAHAILAPWNPQRGKDTPFEAASNVPLIVVGPQVGAPGTESAALVHAVDLFATIAEIAGLSLGDDGPLAEVAHDGLSLLPLLADPAADWPREVVHVEKFLPAGLPPYHVDWRISRDASFKVIEVLPALPLVYDLRGRVDDGEPISVDDLPADDRAEVDRLNAAHAAFWETLDPPTPR